MRTHFRTLVTVFITFVSLVTGFAQSAPPAPPETALPLNVWFFQDTNWLSVYDEPPLSQTNIDLVSTWDNFGLQVDSANAAWLNYPIIETDGWQNLDLTNGSVRFWFLPNWVSTNLDGTGPGDWAPLLTIGNWTSNATSGWWSLYLDPAGCNLSFSAQTNNGFSTNYLSLPVSWDDATWHEIQLTWSVTNIALYLDGAFATNGPGLTILPPAAILTNGFYVGSDASGLQQAHGQFDALWTFASAEIDTNAIASEYAESATLANPPRFRANDSPGSPGDGGSSGSGGGPVALDVSYGTNNLWLEFIGITNNNSYLLIHSPTNGTVYDIFATTNLGFITPGLNLTNWIWLTRGDTNQTNFIITNIFTNTCFYLAARTNDSDGDGLTDAFEHFTSHSSPTNADTFSRGLPDGWQWNYFGNFTQTASGDYDGDGVSNGLEHSRKTDPNKIRFSIIVTNQYVITNHAPISLAISGGVPFNIAVLVDSTNFTNADWAPYTSTNVTVALGTNEGWHDVWVGLRGLPIYATNTWRWQRLNLDLTPPTLVLTGPTNTTTSRPIIQVMGYCKEALNGLSYDLTNAAGLLTNQPVYTIGQFLDTNTSTLTTNYFQAYDVGLAAGTNVLTFHLTDHFGNTTTTNVTYILDYSANTNAPVITVTYPLTNSLIASSNFTLQGYLDNDTATLMVSNNDGSQTVSALVERGGAFSAANIILTVATNQFTLFATDAAGHTSTQSLTVRQSSLTLAIDPLTADQLSQPTVTLSGTISDASKSVWVNGSPATVDGNNWSATIAPPANGTFTGLIQGGDTLTSPEGDLSFFSPMPPTIQTVSFTEIDLSANYDGFPPNTATPGRYYGYKAKQEWTFGTGGDSTSYKYKADGTSCSTSVTWPTNWPGGTTLDGASSCDTPYNEGTPATWRNSLYKYSNSGLALDDLGVLDTPFSREEVHITETTIRINAGGPAQMGVSKLIRLTATAAAYSSSDRDYGSAGDLPVLGNRISLLGHTLTQTATNSHVGELFLTMLGGAVLNPPISVVDSNNAPSTNYSFALVAAKHPLTIVANGTNLFPDAVAIGANFCVGQNISFSLTNLPAGATATNFQWTFDGTFVNTSNQPCPTCSVNYTNDPALLKNAVITNCWWVSGGFNPAATYTASVTCTLLFTNGNPSQTFQTKGKFTMLSPIPEFHVEIRDQVRVGTNHSVNGGFTGATYLYFGINHDPSNAGIAFVYTNAPFTPSSTNTYGQYFVTQVIDYIRQRYNLIDSSGCKGYETNDFQGLDTQNPYQDRTSSLSNFEWTDAPNAELSSAHWLSQTNSFSTYLMFQPTNNGAIAVPMYKVVWNWFGSATNGPPWGKASGSASASNPETVTLFPHWTHTISGVNTLPQFMFQTNCFEEN